MAATTTDSFTLIGRRMRKATRPAASIEEMPSIAEVLRRIDLALAERKAA